MVETGRLRRRLLFIKVLSFTKHCISTTCIHKNCHSQNKFLQFLEHSNKKSHSLSLRLTLAQGTGFTKVRKSIWKVTKHKGQKARRRSGSTKVNKHRQGQKTLQRGSQSSAKVTKLSKGHKTQERSIQSPSACECQLLPHPSKLLLQGFINTLHTLSETSRD